MTESKKRYKSVSNALIVKHLYFQYLFFIEKDALDAVVKDFQSAVCNREFA